MLICAFDGHTGKLWFGRNGVQWYNSPAVAQQTLDSGISDADLVVV